MTKFKKSLHLTFNDQTKSIEDWAKEYEINLFTVKSRIELGWSIEDALTIPVKKRINNFSTKITINNQTKSIEDWAKEYEINLPTLGYRLRSGWSIEEALTTPSIAAKSKHKVFNQNHKSLSTLAQEYGIKLNTLKKRLRLGWSIEKALTTPIKVPQKSLLLENNENVNEIKIEINFNNEVKSLYAWAKELGLNPMTLYQRLYNGWSVEKAFTTPTRSHHVLISFDGKAQDLNSWAKELKIKPVTLSRRLKSGWSVEKALTTPVKTGKNEE